MLQLTPKAGSFWRPHRSIFAAALGCCSVRQALGDNPLEVPSTCFATARARPQTLALDGQGYWLCMKRLSQGRFTWLPRIQDARGPLSARELHCAMDGDPERAHDGAGLARMA